MKNNIDNKNTEKERKIEKNRILNEKCIKCENGFDKQNNKINNTKIDNNIHKLNDKQNVKTIVHKDNKTNPLNKSYNLQKELTHLNTFTINTIPNNKSVYSNNYLLSLTQKEKKCKINSINSRTLTMETLLEIINEIYQSKEVSDKTSKELKQTYETLEQHMYTYLNHKSELKSLILEWANAIIDGIRKYSKQNSEILLFAKILRNEIEETQIILIKKLKSTINEYLHFLLQNTYPFKTKNEINKMVNKIKKEYLNHEQWTNITQYLFRNENDLLLLNEKIYNYIKRNKKYTNEYKIKYQKFIQLIIEFQIKLRSAYLKNFNIMFNNIDKGKHGILNKNEFESLMEVIGINNKNRINEYIHILDPYNNDTILYGDIVNLLSKEIIYEKDIETNEMIEINLMDSIAMKVPYK